MGWKMFSNGNRIGELKNSSWKGYEAEKIMVIIYEKDWSKMTEIEWRSMLRKVIDILEPYYLSIKYSRNSENSMVPMLSERQMETFRNILHVISHGDMWSAIREWTDFIHNYGKYKNHCFSQLETYIIYILAQQILDLL